jgi:hypothetical protein
LTTPRITDRLLALAGVRFIVWILVAASLTPSLWNVGSASPHNVTSHYDEHYFVAHEEAARISMAEYHEVPAWNPYYCGGIPLAANPQDEALAPDFLLRMWFGTGVGRRLAVLLFLVMGMEGFFRLLRRHDASVIGAAAGAFVFAASGRFFFMLEFGWINMFGFQLLPFAVLALEEGARSWRWRVFGGFIVGWMLLAGGTYSVPYTVLVLVALTLFDTLEALVAPRPLSPSPWWRGIASLASIGAFSALFSAAKLFPMLRVIGEHPRTIHNRLSISGSQVLQALLTSHFDKPTGLAAEAYVGGGVLFLAGVALLVRDRAAARAMAMALLFFAIAMGDQGRHSLWSMLRHLPLYGQLRDPDRFALVVGFFLAFAVARALTWVEDGVPIAFERVRARWRAWRKQDEVAPALWLRIVLALAGAVGALVIGRAIQNDLTADVRAHQVIFSQDPPLSRKAEFRQARGNRWDAQVWPPLARGSLQCFEETEFPQSPRLRGDLVAEEYPGDPTSAKVDRLAWTPNHITLDVVAKVPTVIYVNQNWVAGWSTDVGTLRSEDGLLALDVPAGKNVVKLAYSDGWLNFGLLITIGTFAFALWLFARWLRAHVNVLRARLEDPEPAPEPEPEPDQSSSSSSSSSG